MLEECTTEMKEIKGGDESTCCMTVTEEVGVSHIIDCRSYSNLRRLSCVMRCALLTTSSLKVAEQFTTGSSETTLDWGCSAISISGEVIR